MATELSTEIKFDVKYTPSTIEIQNEEVLDSVVTKLTEQYGSLVFTDENVDEAKKAKAELNSFIKTIEDNRKLVKKDYSKPLNEFETKMKSYAERIKDVSADIDEGIKSFEAKEKEKRKEKILALIGEMSETHGVTIDEIEFDNSWLNKGSFTTKGEPNKKTIEAIHSKMGFVANEKARIANEKEMVANIAKLNGLEPYAWENMIDQGMTSTTVVDRINQAVEQKKRDEEEAERRRIAKEEYELAMQKLKEDQEQQIGEKTIDVETGEIVTEPVEEMKQAEVIAEEEPMMSFTLKITGTKDKLYALNQYMTEQGIYFEKVVN